MESPQKEVTAGLLQWSGKGFYEKKLKKKKRKIEFQK
jgi:hypothetical protein